ncbi:SsrA-binding protein SmpB [Candidatus Nomurabacteria bacterium]|nr:SsrA-binding protein SmpB [Candidatus Nomurabacteria bacterium]
MKVIYAENKKATFNYEVLEKYEGGLSLLGLEVKAVKSKKANLEGSYIVVRGGEVFLVNATIQPYQMNNTPKEYDPVRVRKILITKKELKELVGADNKNGLTLIPISLYNKGNKIKLEFALARGKKKTDKRETIKARESKREIERTLKNQR